jgi:hypothetical protein
MAPERAPLRIRSYRQVTRFERRLHRVGPWQIPLPYGVPVAGLLYAGAGFLVLLVLGRLPLTGALLHPLPAPLRLGLLPAAAAWALCRVRPDGRPPLRVAAAWTRQRVGPKRVAAFRPAARPRRALRPADIPIRADARGPALPQAMLAVPRRGEGLSFVLRYPCAVWGRGRTLHVRQLEGGPLWQGTQVTLRPGQRARFEGIEAAP